MEWIGVVVLVMEEPILVFFQDAEKIEIGYDYAKSKMLV